MDVGTLGTAGCVLTPSVEGRDGAPGGLTLLFEQRFWAGIADGSVTVTFRRWKRRQALAGRTYRSPAGRLDVTSVDVVDPASITDGDARRSGFGSAAELVAGLRGTPDLPVYRIEFRLADGPDPRAELAAADGLSAADVADIDTRLDRLDKASSHGPWTRQVLQLIADRPEVRAADLAGSVGRETQPFKLDVRKLKNLGLTVSLERGYHLSPRGRAYLSRFLASKPLSENGLLAQKRQGRGRR